MILQALVDYYDRMADDPESGVAPLGWEYRRLGWVVTVNAQGKATALTSTYEMVPDAKGKKKKTAHLYRVPVSVARARNISANLLWDNPEYVLAKSKEDAKHPEESVLKQSKFIEKIESLNLDRLKPIVCFLKDGPEEQLKQFDAWAELDKDAAAGITFEIEGDGCVVCDLKEVRDAYENTLAQTCADGRCMITGRRCQITKTAGAIKLIGGTTSGCKLVSFQKSCGFDSYGKQQGDNAPIAEEVTFKYTTAVNHLLQNPATHCSLGGDTLIFWASKKSAVEDAFAMLFGANASGSKGTDDESKVIKGIYASIRQGTLMQTLHQDDRFYILGLQPNSARIAVRLWVEQSVKETAEHVRRYFEDMDIVRKTPDEPIPLYSILRAISTLEDIKNLPPKFAGDFLHAAFTGKAFPDNLARAALRQIRTGGVTSVRAAVLKAWLTRKLSSTERKPTLMLDLENTTPGYLLGRLFAVCEKAQKEAVSGANTTIVDRYYATASASPAAVFATLLRLNMHHVRKIGGGREVTFEKLKTEILASLKSFPAHLDLAGQAAFALGFYHQMQDFFTKKDSDNPQE